MAKSFETEREGQFAFFDDFQIPYEEDDSILRDNTDGVWKGNLLEFKLNVTAPNKTLFQTIKYLSRMRVRGESVPAYILLVSLNDEKAYAYSAENYREHIETVYSGAASRSNEGFIAGVPDEEIDYSTDVGASRMRQLLKREGWMKVNLDEDCIVGWAERYYHENPKASKGDFIGDDTGKVRIIGEIREPKHFKDSILPYTKPTNARFKYLMDKLNDSLHKKELGAFYTPEPYCRLACGLVFRAIARTPQGNDFIILDRCAGTGNLEAPLRDVTVGDALAYAQAKEADPDNIPDDPWEWDGLHGHDGESVLSHCIVSTYEYYEYKVLMERMGQDVREIIPPTESKVKYSNGMVANADAMSEEYVNNPVIKQYIDDDAVTVILYENPPYADSSSSTFNDGDKTKQYKTNRKELFVTKEYIENMSELNEGRNSSQELSNLFIWSGMFFYLRQPTDSCVMFSPVKYFKSIHLVKKKMVAGFAFNRKHFHATESVISCVLWSNEDSIDETWDLKSFDIDATERLVSCPDIHVRKCYKTLAESIQKIKDVRDVETDVVCVSDGSPERSTLKKGRKPVYNENIIGYYVVGGYAVAPINRYLVRCNWKSGLSKTMGNHLRKSNYLIILPMFVAKLFPQDNWYEKDVYFTSSDGGDAYTYDDDLLRMCLIYTCLSQDNKCLSFRGTDGRDYQNELCFDGNSQAMQDLKTMKTTPEEDELLALWDKILSEAKHTKNYDSKWRYGVYQIKGDKQRKLAEKGLALNTFHKEQSGKGSKVKDVPDYPQLNDDLDTLRVRLKEYYKRNIQPKLFKYELLK